MQQTFKVKFHKHYFRNLSIYTLLWIIGATIWIVLGKRWTFTGRYYFGIIIMIIVLANALIKTIRYYKSRYTLDGNVLTSHIFFDSKQRYDIDKIDKIYYVDVDPYSDPNLTSRKQLAVYCDRKYLKSVLPIYIAPADRDAFVKVLLAQNPNISVNTE